MTATEDFREQAEREMRDRVLFGPPANDPFAHGHRMATTVEDYVRYAPASEREPIMAQAQFQEALWNEFQSAYPELAADPDATSRVIDYTKEQLKRHGENPDRWIRQNPEQFLKEVALNQQAGIGRSYLDDDTGHRTAGITTGGAVPQRERPEDKLDDTQWMKQWQQSKGIY